jgi:hypothetical protein
VWKLVLVVVAACFLGTPSSAQPTEAERVSLIALIADPASYEGHRVQVVGYLNLEFEGNGLYVSKSDFDASVPRNAIWIDSNLWRDKAKSRRLSRRYALAEGTFTATGHGHVGLFAGELRQITRLEPWGGRAQFYEMMGWRPPGPAIVAVVFVFLVTAGTFWIALKRRP